MTNVFVDIVGKLPLGLVEMYQAVQEGAAQTETLVVGAMARDLILHHGFGADIERGTRDVDFAIQIGSWQQYNELKTALVGIGFRDESPQIYRLAFTDSEGMPWELDILPFGRLENEQRDICWPPDGEIKMSMLGFDEALKHAWQVRIADAPECIIKVANPIAMIALKMIAWTEREPNIRRKDAHDVAYIIKSYQKIPNIETQLYTDGYMEDCDWDADSATAMLLGQQLGQILSEKTQLYLKTNFINNSTNYDAFSAEMNPEHGAVWMQKLIKPA
jgi:predicted nucleotidyltransferase